MSAKNLSVFLNERSVGVLTQLPDGRTFLAFNRSYMEDPSRPILSLSYKNVLNDLQKNAQPPSVGLPPFFSNLLPEGKLRKYLAEKANIKETQEFRLLTALKDDLPGAVILLPDASSQSSSADVHDKIIDQKPSGDSLRFSLAGVQMKFSGDLRDSKIVIPAKGIGGHWIVKLPSPGYAYVNEVEYSMLLLASRIGIQVPDFQLTPTAYIENLPHDLPEALEGYCLLSRRFDRTNDGGRIHMEDFAQVFNVIDKYDPIYNYQSIANVLWIEIGLEAILEFVRRLVHMVITGNADMHLKNWSLIYPNGRQPRLAPAYDFISTAVYSDIDRTLPHKIAGIRDFNKINIDTFKTFAQIAKLPERSVLRTVEETVDLIKDQWRYLRSELPIPESYKRLIEEQMSSVPLTHESKAKILSISPKAPPLKQQGSYIKCHIILDETISDGMILYKNQQNKSIEAKAPRRMVDALMQKQLHQLMLGDDDFKNRVIEGRVGKRLYDEWRQDTFIRIQHRQVRGGLNMKNLQEPRLAFQATFFPIDWQKLEKQYKAKELPFTIDFVLDNGDLWTCECTLTSLNKVELLPAGTVADIVLSIKSKEYLFASSQ
ncbi:MAG: type II toxin-antitoxin system HipA family toxin [Candidatus Obscuribacterales bacterium]|nr:type II toxin-antitoxin system HipA family toxin [Candidatus Obscuribacterales bacterium]